MATVAFRECKQTLWSLFQSYCFVEMSTSLLSSSQAQGSEELTVKVIREPEFRSIMAAFAQRDGFERYFAATNDVFSIERGLAHLHDDEVLVRLWAVMARTRARMRRRSPRRGAITSLDDLFAGAAVDVAPSVTIDWAVMASVLFLYLHDSLGLSLDPAAVAKARATVQAGALVGGEYTGAFTPPPPPARDVRMSIAVDAASYEPAAARTPPTTPPRVSSTGHAELDRLLRARALTSVEKGCHEGPEPVAEVSAQRPLWSPEQLHHTLDRTPLQALRRRALSAHRRAERDSDDDRCERGGGGGGSGAEGAGTDHRAHAASTSREASSVRGRRTIEIPVEDDEEEADADPTAAAMRRSGSPPVSTVNTLYTAHEHRRGGGGIGVGRQAWQSTSGGRAAIPPGAITVARPDDGGSPRDGRPWESLGTPTPLRVRPASALNTAPSRKTGVAARGSLTAVTIRTRGRPKAGRGKAGWPSAATDVPPPEVKGKAAESDEEANDGRRTIPFPLSGGGPLPAPALEGTDVDGLPAKLLASPRAREESAAEASLGDAAGRAAARAGWESDAGEQPPTVLSRARRGWGPEALAAAAAAASTVEPLSAGVADDAYGADDDAHRPVAPRAPPSPLHYQQPHQQVATAPAPSMAPTEPSPGGCGGEWYPLAPPTTRERDTWPSGNGSPIAGWLHEGGATTAAPQRDHARARQTPHLTQDLGWAGVHGATLGVPSLRETPAGRGCALAPGWTQHGHKNDDHHYHHQRRSMDKDPLRPRHDVRQERVAGDDGSTLSLRDTDPRVHGDWSALLESPRAPRASVSLAKREGDVDAPTRAIESPALRAGLRTAASPGDPESESESEPDGGVGNGCYYRFHNCCGASASKLTAVGAEAFAHATPPRPGVDGLPSDSLPQYPRSPPPRLSSRARHRLTRSADGRGRGAATGATPPSRAPLTRCRSSSSWTWDRDSPVSVLVTPRRTVLGGSGYDQQASSPGDQRAGGLPSPAPSPPPKGGLPSPAPSPPPKGGLPSPAWGAGGVGRV